MKKIISVIISAACLIAAASGCGDKKEDSSESSEQTSSGDTMQETTQSSATGAEPVTEAPTKHISPTETLSAECSTQQTVSRTILREEDSNTIKLPLADFIEEGDRITSFTFVIYSGDGSDIGEFKGGCGISVSAECTAATSKCTNSYPRASRKSKEGGYRAGRRKE